MNEAFARTALLIGEEGLVRLASQGVTIVGLGGVGSYVAEALARCGIGSFILVDHDLIQESNINRQIHATVKTLGRSKVEVMGERILDINPKAKVEVIREFFPFENGERLLRPGISYVVDSIDTVSSKIELVLLAKRLGVPIISSMGTGNKLDPSRFEAADISETSVCPLARVMRRELRKRGVDSLKVVYSREEPIDLLSIDGGRKKVPGSVSFVPSAAGLLIASLVVRDFLGK